MNRNGLIYQPLQLQSAYYSTVLPSLFVGDVATINIAAVSSSMRNESLKRIEGFQSLRDNWDGYGAYAPSGAVCNHATLLINQLALDFPDVPSPDISPSSNGTVIFSWETGLGEAVLEIGEANFGGYIGKPGSFAPLSGNVNSLSKQELSVIAGYLG